MSSEEVKQQTRMDAFDYDANAEEGVEGSDARLPATTRVIQGDRLSFTNDFIWLVGTDQELPQDRGLVPVDTIRIVQKWVNKMPEGHIVVEPGKKWPDIDALNKDCPKSEWGTDFNGKPQGPWQRQRITYFVDMETMTKYTWPAATVGAEICLGEFRDKVRMMRQFRGEQVYAVVTLGSVFMATKYGGRERPQFVVQRWITLGSTAAALPAPSAPTALPSANVQTVEEPSLREQMNDELPPWNNSPGVNAAPPKTTTTAHRPKPAATNKAARGR
jgi:hypothetical protein